MTVSQLREDLQYFPGNAEIVFATKDYCPEGYPEWESVWVRQEDNGKVYIEMHRLTRECQPDA